ncbi:microsomal signal peptidase 25 kDa subunit-domain-containing protein [Thelonectria olida]|uniref:Signal peptidase complex subunit 2 n=1 Tax=Thelonectria olida TaxID=1576542 RepID=A0A9P9AR44_9HYPO|nr:microsomal signal peptidase 25 kDa subunit-domain-containing protein [Thelonectria olida]
MSNATERVSLYSLSDLKATSDDALPNYLNSLKFKQSHFLTDVRLALGYFTFAISGVTFLWDHKYGFAHTKQWTAVAVAVYFVFNTILTWWMLVTERGVVYQGTAPSGEFISIVSATKKNVPVYNLTITVTDKASKKHVFTFSKPFTAWFDETGRFVAVPFQELLATTVPLVGKCDPKRVTVSQDLLDATPEVLDAILAANSAAAVGSSSAAEVAGKGGKSKRRKA